MQIWIKICAILYFLLFCGGVLQSQSATENERVDIIYFKNGKKQRGIVLKQQFGTISLKITDSITQKENIKIYQQSDILKIEKGKEIIPVVLKDSLQNYKEGGINKAIPQPGNTGNIKAESTQMLMPEHSRQGTTITPLSQTETVVESPVLIDQPIYISGSGTGDPDDYFDPFSIPRPKRKESIWNRQIRGFRVFLDYAYIHGIGKEKNNRIEYMGSVGFQFNPIFYTGLGIGYDMTLNNKDSALPVFINQRINFLDDYKTPFWDVKIGYSVAAGKGFYCSTSLGMSFTKRGRRAFNLGLVYSLQNAEFYDWSDSEPKAWVSKKELYHGIAIKLSYEFGVGR